jgi:hypothetical protein
MTVIAAAVLLHQMVPVCMSMITPLLWLLYRDGCLDAIRQEEERERRMDFVPEESAIVTETIEVCNPPATAAAAAAAAALGLSAAAPGCRHISSRPGQAHQQEQMLP